MCMCVCVHLIECIACMCAGVAQTCKCSIVLATEE